MKRKKSPNQKAFKIVTQKTAPVILPSPPVEEVGAEIGSEKNVSFAMSIALQMKDQQRKADAAKKAEAEIVFKKRNIKYSDADLENFRKKLLAVSLKMLGGFKAANSPFDEKKTAISVCLIPGKEIKSAVKARARGPRQEAGRRRVA